MPSFGSKNNFKRLLDWFRDIFIHLLRNWEMEGKPSWPTNGNYCQVCFCAVQKPFKMQMVSIGVVAQAANTVA